MDALSRWPKLRSLAMVEVTREINGAVSTERGYYISSLPPNALTISQAVRSHWHADNRCIGHSTWPSAKIGAVHGWTTPHGTSLSFRRIVMSLRKRDTTSKVELKIRRLKKRARTTAISLNSSAGKTYRNLTF